MQTGNETIQVNGNEAAALAAVVAGVDFFSHYPGSPVNFVEPALRRYVDRYGLLTVFNDSLNEHIAALAAGGASIAGARSMVVMKHVGINIAADPLVYLGYTGVKGGMVVVVGTDPGANASTGEQDVHWYARMFNFPLFEPVTVGEIYRLCIEAFKISEQYNVPCFLFIPASLAFDSERISSPNNLATQRTGFRFIRDKERYINVGLRNVANHARLLDKIHRISLSNTYVKVVGNEAAKTALLTRGLCFTLVYELIYRSDIFNELLLINVDMVFPLPDGELRRLLAEKDEIYVIEDQDGFLEQELKMRLFNDLKGKIYGKDFIPAAGGIDSELIQRLLSKKLGLPHSAATIDFIPGDIPECLGTFCEGCPHRAVFYVLDKLIEEGVPAIIGGDIGCSSLPPFRADWLMCMNAGIGISQGISQMNTGQLMISTGGDGSFFHGGLISLKSAVENKINLIHLVLDNKSIAMTGHQHSPSQEKRFDPRKLLEQVGVDRFYRLKATQTTKLERTLKAEIDGKGVRVFWIDGQCSRLDSRWRDFKIRTFQPEIETEKCYDCTLCFGNLSCPAIEKKDGANGFEISLETCMRCGTCRRICPEGAISASLKDPIRNFIRVYTGHE